MTSCPWPAARAHAHRRPASRSGRGSEADCGPRAARGRAAHRSARPPARCESARARSARWSGRPSDSDRLHRNGGPAGGTASASASSSSSSSRGRGTEQRTARALDQGVHTSAKASERSTWGSPGISIADTRPQPCSQPLASPPRDAITSGYQKVSGTKNRVRGISTSARCTCSSPGITIADSTLRPSCTITRIGIITCRLSRLSKVLIIMIENQSVRPATRCESIEHST